MTRIADVLHVRGRFTRSVHLERDFGKCDSQDYVVTPQTKAVLGRLVQGLGGQSRQRAWRITGDYGTGKSSFAVALAHLLGERHRRLPSPLRHAIDFRRLGTGRPKLLPVLVTGSREPIVVAVLRGLQKTLEECRTRGKESRVLLRVRALAKAASKGIPEAVAVNMVEEANEYVCSTGKGTGLLIIIDELGKFLEFAALHPDRQDVGFLQNLAEAAARSGTHPIFVVGLLHQGFSAYAEQLSQVVQKEWEKVAGRFDEVLFNQPLEQTAALVAHALGVRTARIPVKLARRTERDMARVVELGWYGPRQSSRMPKNVAVRLYPLHPTVLPVLARLFSRFGQNERSLFGFLLSDEPFGLRDFCEQSIHSGAFYRLHNLYDYTRTAFGSRLGVQSLRSHWNQVEAVVESFPRENERQLQVLKTVALLNLLDMANLIATDEILSVAVGGGEHDAEREVREAVQNLAREKRVLYYRGAAGGYCLWPHTSVDLAKVYEEACKAVGTPQRLSDSVRESLETRPLVARRHYIETGNLRSFDVIYASMAELPGLAKVECDGADGRIIVPLCETAEERQEALAFARSPEVRSRPDVLVAVPKPLNALAGLVQECQRWQWISQNVPELNNDSFGAEEVTRQLLAARHVLERRIRSSVGLRQFTEAMELQWFRIGAPLDIGGGRDLLEVLSSTCDEVFHAAPRIKNELVNRNDLSSAAAAARMRLIERIIKHPTLSNLGMDPAKRPPEMSMYLSVMKEASLHREVEGAWAIAEPSTAFDPCRLLPVFQCMREVLEKQPDRRVSVADLFAKLRRRPYGVRAGLVPLLLGVFAIAHEPSIAFYENGLFLRHLSGEDFLRLVKVPASFEIQFCRIDGVRAVVFDKLRRVLAPEDSQLRKVDLLDVVRPLCQFAAQLPAYTHRTRLMSPSAVAIREVLLHAREPASLLFKQLPEACGFREFQVDQASVDSAASRFVAVLKDALSELKAAFPDLLNRMEGAVVTAFGRPGTIQDARQSLSAVANRLLVVVSDPQLKALCFRLADTSLGGNTWVESLGSLLCGKPPSKWSDSDFEMFLEELSRSARQFQRVEAMAFDVVKDKSSTAIRVAVTQQDGVELDHVLYVGRDEEAQAAEIEAMIGGILRDTRRVGMVAASRALGKALAEARALGAQRGAHSKKGS